MRLLLIITVSAIVIGAAIVVIVFITWPEWNPAQVQQNMSALLGEEVPLEYITEPARPDRWAWAGGGGALFVFGVMAGLTTLHAAAVRPQRVIPAGEQ